MEKLNQESRDQIYFRLQPKIKKLFLVLLLNMKKKVKGNVRAEFVLYQHNFRI